MRAAYLAKDLVSTGTAEMGQKDWQVSKMPTPISAAT